MTANPQIQQLAAQLAKQAAAPPKNMPTFSQGVITAWNPGNNPPDVSITLSGSTVVIQNVRYQSTYLPTVGDVVQVVKQGGALLVIGTVASVPSAGLSPQAMQVASPPIITTGSVASVNFSGFSQAFSHLMLLICAQSDDTSSSSGVVNLQVQINGDVSANYNNCGIALGVGGTIIGGSGSGQSAWNVGNVWNSFFGSSPGAGLSTITFPFYSQTVHKKGFTSNAYASDGGGNGQMIQWSGANASNSNAITSINIGAAAGDFISGSYFSLYGIL